jgi:hypothetical protein
MTVDATVNYYGARQLGQSAFEKEYEKLGLIPKLRALLKACDGIEIDSDHPLLQVTRRLADRRNGLVHPKVKGVLGSPSPSERAGRPSVPEASQAIFECDEFLECFFALATSASGLDPRPVQANTR